MTRPVRIGTLLLVSVALVALAPGGTPGAFATPAPAAPGGAGLINGWRSGGPPGGPVQALAVGAGAPERIWAGTMFTRYLWPRPGQASVSLDGARTWNAVGDLAYLPIAAYAVDPADADVVYAGVGLNTDGTGLYKTTDGGAHWVYSLYVRWTMDIDIDPTDPSKVYVASREGLWSSTDAGATWSRTDRGISDNNVLSVAVDPFDPHVVYAGTLSHGLYRSTDGGGRWSKSGTGLPSDRVNAILPDPTVPGRVYAGTVYGAALSTDGGASWTGADAGMGPRVVLSLAEGAQHPGRLFAGTSRGVYRSDDGAASWVQISQGLPRTQVGAVALDPRDDDVVYAGTGVGVFKTDDGGASWHERNRGMANSDVAGFAVSGQVVYAGENNRGGVYRSGDDGATWRLTATGLPPDPAYNLAVSQADPDKVYAVAALGLFVTTDGGRDWEGVSTPAGVVRLAVAPSDPRVVYVTTLSDVPGRYPVWRSDDGGATWQGASADLPDESVWIVSVDPTRPHVAYAGGYDSLFRTNDGGATWHQASGGIPNSFDFGGVAIDPVHPNVLYASVEGDLFRSSNYAVQWHPVDVTGCEPSGDVAVGGVAVDPDGNGVLYITRGTAVCRGTGGGAEWSNLPTPVRDSGAIAGPAVAADGSVLVSIKGGGVVSFPAP